MKLVCFFYTPKNLFSTKRILQEVTNVKSRLHIKQTIGDKKKLQQFLEKQVKDGRVIETLNRTSKYDDGFKQFLDDFKQKNNMPNITDISAASNMTKSNQTREDELRILKQFAEKRKRGLFERQTEYSEIDRIDLRDDSYVPLPADELDKKDVQQTRSGIQVEGDFHTLLIDRDVTTQVTTLQRVNHFRTIVFMGNGNGVIGYGKGKGGDFEQALTNALQDCKRNLIPIPIDIYHTCPLHLQARFNNYKLEITPRASGFNAYGHPAIAYMLMLTGMTHCGFKVIHRGTKPYAMVAVFFKTITQTLSPQDISERLGIKIYRQFWGKRLPREVIAPPQM